MTFQKWLTIIGFVAILIIGGIIGWHLKRCPTVKIGTETTMVTVTVHDTVTNVKQGSDIQAGTKTRTIYVPVHDTITKTDTMKSILDTSTCYSFDETEKDGSYIKAEMCSDSLPAVKPIDLTGKITYVAHPDTSRKIVRVDTVMRDKKIPPLQDWRTYVMAILAMVAGGFAIANASHK